MNTRIVPLGRSSVLLSLLLVPLWAAHAEAPKKSKTVPTMTAERARAVPAIGVSGKKYGIEPVSARLAAHGYLVYVRYRIVDSAKAKPLFKDGLRPYVVDHESKQRLSMPTDTKLGALRSSPRAQLVNGKEYYVLFNNPGRKVKKGSKLDVVMGDCKLSNVPVQ